jgi:hypothetical protein
MLITGQGQGILSGKKVKVPDMFRKSLRFWWIAMKIACFTKSVKPDLHAILVQRAAFSGNYRLNLAVNDHELGHSNQ